MDAKARQDCIKEIDLLKVKNQRRGRQRHALHSVLLRCLSWDLLPQENNWSAPDGLDLRVGVWARAHVCMLPGMVMNAEGCFCTQVRIWMSVCDCTVHVLLSPYVSERVCVCVCARARVHRRTSVTSLQAHIDSFLNAKSIVFYLFVMFRGGQQCISMEI